MDRSILQKIGLTEGEIRVYLAMFDLGLTTVGPIMKSANISSSKIYLILDRLAKKGLINYITKNKTSYFQVALPEKLLSYISLKEKELQKEKAELAKLIPQLKQKLKSREEEKGAAVFEDIEGIKTFYLSLLDYMKKGEEYYVFTVSAEEMKRKSIQAFFWGFHLKRERKRVTCKIITNEKFTYSWMKKAYSKFKFLKFKRTNQEIPSNTIIFKSRMAFLNFKGAPVVYVLKNENIAQSYAEFFKSIWGKPIIKN